MKPIITVSAIELTVGLRSAARLLVLRARVDVAQRRESLAEAAPFVALDLPLSEATLNQINDDPLCLACEKEAATGRGVLITMHSCAGDLGVED